MLRFPMTGYYRQFDAIKKQKAFCGGKALLLCRFSSAEEQSAVNRQVAGSSPANGSTLGGDINAKISRRQRYKQGTVVNDRNSG